MKDIPEQRRKKLNHGTYMFCHGQALLMVDLVMGAARTFIT